MHKNGKALESVVATLERALASNPNVRVRSPRRLPDRTTGKLREHDVVLELNEGHHTLLVAIECRDRSRPVGVPQVEAFNAKCLDTGISRGVIVSTTGFCKSARIKANHLGIACLDIEGVGNFDWLLAAGVYSAQTRLLSGEWTFFPVEDGVVKGADFEVVDCDGNVAVPGALNANVQRALTNVLPEFCETSGEKEITFRFSGDGLFLRSTATGDTVSVDFALAKVRVMIKCELLPLQLLQYKDGGGNRLIADAAYVDIKLEGKDARLMIVYKENEGGKVLLVPDSDKR